MCERCAELEAKVESLQAGCRRLLAVLVDAQSIASNAAAPTADTGVQRVGARLSQDQGGLYDRRNRLTEENGGTALLHRPRLQA